MKVAVVPTILTLTLTTATRTLDASDADGMPSVSGARNQTKYCSQACLAQALGELKRRVLVMYVSEIFKVERGRIVHIDNIGLVKPGREHTTGFARRR